MAAQPTAAVHEGGGGVPAAETKARELDDPSPLLVRYIKSVYEELSANFKWSSKSDLGVFLRDVQKIQLPDKLDAEPSKDTFQRFREYLISPNANALAPLNSNDLTYPISNYFISSSHNTYLTGNQLSSDSSVESYQNVLLRGCRCVEIDVWDGKPIDDDEDPEKAAGEEHSGLRGHMKHFRDVSINKIREHQSMEQHEVTPPGNASVEMPAPWKSATKIVEPRVLHGHTLTKDVPFRSVCEVIRDAAFQTSDLPIIISLEIHTNLEQQQMMVDIMEEIWKGHLVMPPGSFKPGKTEGDLPSLPSPGELRKKILIKVKYTPPSVAKKDEAKAEVEVAKAQTRSSSTSSASDDDRPKAEKMKKVTMLDALSRLGVYTQAYHFKSFEAPEAKIPTHIFSLSERALIEAHETKQQALFEHNRNFLMRAYPRGLRISSSNLNPALFWRQGVQVVALNWQKCDKSAMLNEAMFAGAGGWILKPDAFRSKPKISNVAQQKNIGIKDKLLYLTIEILAAQNLPLPKDKTTTKGFRPYVRVTLHVEKLEDLKSRPMKDQRTRSDSEEQLKQGKVKQNTKARKCDTGDGSRAGDNAVDFEREVLRFPDVWIDTEELSFVRFKVLDDVGLRTDPLVAWSCIRLDRLREGYRFVHLYDADGVQGKGVLFVKITKAVSHTKEPRGTVTLPLR